LTSSVQLQVLARDALEELKGVDIVAIDVSKRTTVTDWMMVVTGTSQRHVKSLADTVVEKCKENGIRPLGMEGDSEADWVLVDLGDVIVHVMTEEKREFYSLEKLWSVGPDNEEQTASLAGSV